LRVSPGKKVNDVEIDDRTEPVTFVKTAGIGTNDMRPVRQVEGQLCATIRPNSCRRRLHSAGGNLSVGDSGIELKRRCPRDYAGHPTGSRKGGDPPWKPIPSSDPTLLPQISRVSAERGGT